jgi:hypothetical protein
MARPLVTGNALLVVTAKETLVRDFGPGILGGRPQQIPVTAQARGVERVAQAILPLGLPVDVAAPCNDLHPVRMQAGAHLGERERGQAPLREVTDDAGRTGARGITPAVHGRFKGCDHRPHRVAMCAESGVGGLPVYEGNQQDESRSAPEGDNCPSHRLEPVDLADWGLHLRHALHMLRRLSRRQLLTALGALPIAGFLSGSIWNVLRRKHAVLDPRAAEAIARVCDRFIPSIDGRPGAIALRIDKKILRDWERSADPEKSLLQLGNRLLRDRFIAMELDAQDAYLQERLLDRQGARLFQRLLDRCVEEFYTHPQSWVSLRYTKPQPEGYPDYARCG